MLQEERRRTTDIIPDKELEFSELLLTPEILKGLNEAGYKKTSPIQLKAIPLGRFGLDLIAQAKSGTGKTCVFSVIALETVDTKLNHLQVLALAPTREIAIQNRDVINQIGKYIEGLQCHALIGGLPISTDIEHLTKCHIAVGTLGRVKDLIESGRLRTSSIRLFIMDEADRLFDEHSFPILNWIFTNLPQRRQTLAFSATYPSELYSKISSFMKEPKFVLISADSPSLEGVKQYYLEIPEMPKFKSFEYKISRLLEILSKMAFHQCLVFSNYKSRASQLCQCLSSSGWPAAYISGNLLQTERIGIIESLKAFQLRVLASTDLTSRGIDVDKINLVVNLDLPTTVETYLHRVGRTGRFGTHGVAITFVSTSQMGFINEAMEKYKTIIEPMPSDIPKEYYAYPFTKEEDKLALVKLEERGERLKQMPPPKPDEQRKKPVSKPESLSDPKINSHARSTNDPNYQSPGQTTNEPNFSSHAQTTNEPKYQNHVQQPLATDSPKLEVPTKSLNWNDIRNLQDEKPKLNLEERIRKWQREVFDASFQLTPETSSDYFEHEESEKNERRRLRAQYVSLNHYPTTVPAAAVTAPLPTNAQESFSRYHSFNPGQARSATSMQPVDALAQQLQSRLHVSSNVPPYYPTYPGQTPGYWLPPVPAPVSPGHSYSANRISPPISPTFYPHSYYYPPAFYGGYTGFLPGWMPPVYDSRKKKSKSVPRGAPIFNNNAV